MKKKSSERRLIENERIIRRLNRSATRALRKYFAPYKQAPDIPLDFSCECSDLDCGEHVTMTIKDYEKLHQRQDRFVLAKGHMEPTVEKIIHNNDRYMVVEKYALDPGIA